MSDSLGELAAKRSLVVAGLMSGTSADGVDVAIVRIDWPRSRERGQGRGPASQVRPAVTTLATGGFPYPPRLRREVFELFSPATGTVDRVCRMNALLGEAFAGALLSLCRTSRIGIGRIDLVGSHGQTIHHLPPGRRGGAGKTGSTLQIGEPCVIAQRTGCTVVADFRPRDLAAGGQGAPLVPLADWVLLGSDRINRAVQNIGGIANVTYLRAGCGLSDVRAFDTGPGNMIIDRLAWHATAGRLGYDRDGRLARAGKVNPQLLGQLMRHPYLGRRPPKTTGREEFGVDFADRLWAARRRAGLSGHDLLATATAFTAASIAGAYRRFLGRVDQAILCGGGARNPLLVEMLRGQLPGTELLDMATLGIDPDAKEAISFAILAAYTIRSLPGNVPSATGARLPVVLGKIVPGNSSSR